MRDFFKAGMIPAIALAMLAPVMAAHAQDPFWRMWQHPTLPSDPKVRAIEFWVGCVDADWGFPLNCDENWESFFAPPTGPPEAVIDYTGGHLHPLPNGADPNRPIWILCSDIDLGPGPGACLGADPRGRVPTKFRGMSKNEFWLARKTAPEVSGKISATAIVTLPSGWWCVESPGWMCDVTRRNALSFVTFDIGVRGLLELPSAPYYVRCGLTSGCLSDNVAPTHPKAFFGTGALVSAVQNLALAFYYFHQDQRLRLTDMSLPRGGLFDIFDNWHGPHDGRGHRIGTGIDVSQQALGGNGGLPSVDQFELDDLGCFFGLSRYDDERPKIHYNLKACPKKKG